MIKRFSILLLCLFGFLVIQAQELFIHNTPASVLPKDAFTIRTTSGIYGEDGLVRFRQAMRIAYGISSTWRVSLEGSFSNHTHPGLVDELFSTGEEVDHSHHGHQHTVTESSVNPQHIHPFKFNGLVLQSQYRFFTHDGPNQHFRAATYQIASLNPTSHNFAEPNLLHRNSGFATGLIGTWLYKKFAASLKAGGIYALPYREKSRDRLFRSGKAMEYALSLGYLAYPHKYKSYKQLNINLYAEFMGSVYGQATIREGVANFPSNAREETIRGAYLDFRPGLQFILGSKFRIDMSTALPFIGRSLTTEYPRFQLNLQYLFFR